MLNRPLRELMLAEISHITSHDWWACLLAVKFGKTFMTRALPALTAAWIPAFPA